MVFMDMTSLVTLLVLLIQHFCEAVVDCPSGDTPGVISNGQTCSELVTANINSCYTFETQCCTTCNGVNTNVAGCEFGDRVTCFTFLCGTSSDPADCCQTCPSYTVAQTTATTTTMAATTTTMAATTTTTMATTIATTTVSSGGGTTATTASATGDTKRHDSDVDEIIGGTFGGVGFVVIASVISIVIYKSKKSSSIDVEGSPSKENGDVKKIPVPDRVTLEPLEKGAEVNGNMTSPLDINNSPLPPITASVTN